MCSIHSARVRAPALLLLSHQSRNSQLDLRISFFYLPFSWRFSPNTSTMGGHLHAGQRRYHVSRREIVELNVAGEPNSRPGGSDCRLVREPDPRLLTDSTRLMTSRRLRAEAIVVSLPGAAMMRGGASDGCFFLIGCCFRL